MANKIFKGIMHVHSRYSGDADFTIKQIKEKFPYDFILFSEHDKGMDKKSFDDFLKDCRKNTSEKFLCVPGLEISRSKAHILLYGTEKLFCDNDKNIEEYFRKEKLKGCLVVLAHPHKIAVSRKIIGMLNGVEAWNFDYNGAKNLPLYQFRLFNKFKKINHKLSAFAGYDFHRNIKNEQIIYVEAGSLTKRDILRSIKHGRFWYKIDGYKIFPDGTVYYKDRSLNAYPLKILWLIAVSSGIKLLQGILRAGSMSLDTLGIKGSGRIFLAKIIKKIYGKI